MAFLLGMLGAKLHRSAADKVMDKECRKPPGSGGFLQVFNP